MGGSVADPVLFSRVGIVTGYAKTTREDELVTTIDDTEQGSAITAGVVWAICLPDCLPRLLVEGDQIAGPVVVAVYDYLVVP